ncbi:MAG: lipoyl synthase, partial [Lentisphaeria bacterium]|nr:lipoyl synthase [Lentisphaeria bacterium]
VVTCVTRDDLPDGGAAHIAATVQAIHKMASGTGVEVLPSDFGGRLESVETVMAARPQVYNHNVETVERLTPCIRDQADYRRSLVSLRHAATLAENTDTSTKSGIMLGLGETDEEIKATLRDLRDAHVSILTIGQYLPPSAKHWPLDRYVTPDEFDRWGEIARRDFGFPSVVSGPMVRSSYHAQEAAETAGSPHREGSSPRRHEGEHGHLTG